MPGHRYTVSILHCYIVSDFLLYMQYKDYLIDVFVSQELRSSKQTFISQIIKIICFPLSWLPFNLGSLPYSLYSPNTTKRIKWNILSSIFMSQAMLGVFVRDIVYFIFFLLPCPSTTTSSMAFFLATKVKSKVTNVQ